MIIDNAVSSPAPAGGERAPPNEGAGPIIAQSTASIGGVLKALRVREREDDPFSRISHEMRAIVGRDGMIVDVNRTWERTLGWLAENVIGRLLCTLAHADDRDRLSLALDDLEDDGATQEFENRLLCANGTYRLAAWSATRKGDYLYCAVRDITEQREREVALHDSKDFARLALSAVNGVGVWTYEVGSDCFFCDAAIAALYGIDPAEAAGGIKRVRFLANVHPDDLIALRKTMTGGLIRRGDLELEYRICHPDGSTRWVLSRGHTYFNDDGMPVRRTGVGLDMTSQRLLEQQLRQSQKMEAVGHLTGGLAHDFNNMLQGVLGPLELIRQLLALGRLSELDRFIGMAMGSARKAAALTHRLLAFARRQPLAPRAVDVAQLIPTLTDLLRQSAAEKIEIRLLPDSQPCRVRCDPHQLESALLNLSINACDAMPDGGTLSVESRIEEVSEAMAQLHQDAHPGRYVCIAVTDTGTGMPQHVVDQAFEPFFTTKPSGRGTGLGLSMVHGFVGQSGGFMRINSQVGSGTIVELLLPEVSTDDGRGDSAVEERAHHHLGSGETVLIVDDNATIRELLGVLFEQSGYRTLSAHDGSSGLAILSSDETVDLVVTDVGLPGMNGRQMIDIARELRPQLPVLFVTGYAEVATANGFLGERMEMLPKPFSLEAVIVRAQSMLQKQGEGKAAAQSDVASGMAPLAVQDREGQSTHPDK
ncbi:PAS domain S-box-containing protein [Robbsia andropogonis]|uniref:hybrid sensor histidine kinase/response regulator n=1 Tax=Robbsia andropogonis TaxID=28092 RepID=UPI003D24A9D7